jgi:alkylhydroperoxidase family enzyme
MPHHSPRIPPLSPDQFTDEQAQIAGDHAKFNIARVMVQHPALYRTYIPFAEQLMRRSNLPPRDREVLVLRTLALCGEAYEAPHHVLIARHIGMTDAEIEAAKTGGEGLQPFEHALARAAEELVRDHCVSEQNWQTLAQRYSRLQLMEAVFLVGAYTMSSMATNSFGVQIEVEAEHITWKPNA